MAEDDYGIEAAFNSSLVITADQPHETINSSVATTAEDLDIIISNITCHFAFPMEIDVELLAMKLFNVKLLSSALYYQSRHAYKATIRKSGKISVMGCKSGLSAYVAARCVARKVQRILNKLDEKIYIENFRITNVNATCDFKYGINLEEMANYYKDDCSYDSQQMRALVWKMKEPHATIKLHSTGSILVYSTSEANLIAALQQIYLISVPFFFTRLVGPRKRPNGKNESAGTSKMIKIEEPLDIEEENEDSHH